MGDPASSVPLPRAFAFTNQTISINLHICVMPTPCLRAHSPWTLKSYLMLHISRIACLALCASQQTTPMRKHSCLIHCWVSEKVEDNEIEFSYIASAENVADLFTNALFKPALRAVFLFSKLINLVFGYFDPVNIFIDNKNK